MDQPDRRAADKRLEAIETQLTRISTDINHLTHGNGRKGVLNLIDDVYGPQTRERPGLFERVVLLEKEVRALAEQRKETRWLQRGIAIGVGVVALDTVFGLDLAHVLRSLFAF